jgi:hypothetical protein
MDRIGGRVDPDASQTPMCAPLHATGAPDDIDQTHRTQASLAASGNAKSPRQRPLFLPHALPRFFC